MIGPAVQGIQSQGVMACTKHFIANEQEHYRQVGESQGRGYNITEALSSNIDDKAMHELYLWPFADAVRAGTASSKCPYCKFRLAVLIVASHVLLQSNQQLLWMC